ncbi:MAG: formylglycine-generating enzyme family protein [bacterium]|nr:formylglycine-generating enzyme family protein [bacterium]
MKIQFILLPLLCFTVLGAGFLNDIDKIRFEGDMVLVKGGTFEMGDVFNEGGESERPVHPVTLNNFYIAKYEITVGEFRRFVDETGFVTNAEKPVDQAKQRKLIARVREIMQTDRENKSEMYKVYKEALSYGGSSFWDPENNRWGFGTDYSWKNTGFDQSDDHPAQCISWDDAASYCNWLSKNNNLSPAYNIKTGELLDEDGKVTTDISRVKGYRLPTEAEWEFAARERGRKVRFGNGKDTADTHDICFDGSRGDYEYLKKSEHGTGTVSVGSFDPNSLGLYDMSGNAWEWCTDYFGPYRSENQKDPYNSEGFRKILKGGMWGGSAEEIRIFTRFPYLSNDRCNNSGFRIARSK